MENMNLDCFSIRIADIHDGFLVEYNLPKENQCFEFYKTISEVVDNVAEAVRNSLEEEL